MRQHMRLIAALAAVVLALAGCGQDSAVGRDIEADKLKGQGGALDIEKQLEEAGDANTGALGEEALQEEDVEAKRREQLEQAAAQQQAAEEKQSQQLEEARAQSAVKARITANGITPSIVKVTTGGVVEVCNEDNSAEDPQYDKVPGRQVETDDERYTYTDGNGVTYGFVSGPLAQGECWQWNVVDPRPERRGQPAMPGKFRYKDTERPFYFGDVCVLPPNGQDSHC